MFINSSFVEDRFFWKIARICNIAIMPKTIDGIYSSILEHNFHKGNVDAPITEKIIVMML